MRCAPEDTCREKAKEEASSLFLAAAATRTPLKNQIERSKRLLLSTACITQCRPPALGQSSIGRVFNLPCLLFKRQDLQKSSKPANALFHAGLRVANGMQ